jgi:protein-S-isoprenylcysteine O-methyltransferase Ste14
MRVRAITRAMFQPLPVSPLQLALALFGMLLFAAAVFEKRMKMGVSRKPASSRSYLSLAGILLQSVAFFIVSIGRIIPTADPLAPSSLALSLIVLFGGASGAWLFRASAKALGDNWSIVARMRPEHSLVTRGPFARVRHPIYLAMLLLLIAWAIGLGHLLALIIAVPLILIGTAIRVREEEKLLIAQFGEGYRAYARATPAFIPRLL